MIDIISRHYINPDIKFYVLEFDNVMHEKNYQDCVETVRRWKVILHEGYGLRQGSSLAIFNTVVGFRYVCLVIAAAELGIRMILAPEKPTSDTGQSSKLDALIDAYGTIDLCILDNASVRSKPIFAAAKLYGKEVGNMSIFDTYQVQNKDLADQVQDIIDADPDAEIMLTTTSGSTGEPKLIIYTHRQIYRIGKRNVGAYNYDRASTCHTRNMHHAFVLMCHFLPTITGTQIHYTNNFNDSDEEGILEFYQFLTTHKISTVVISYKTMLDGLLNTMIKHNLKFDYEVDLVVGGYYITEDYVDKVRATNVYRILSTFGSNETMAPILLRIVDQNTSTQDYKDNYLGKPCDDYYDISVDADQQLVVRCPDLYDGTITMPDKFEGNNEQGYFHQGRDNFYRIDHHDISLQKVQGIVYKYATGDYSITVDLPYQKLYLVLWNGEVDLASLNHEMRERVGIPFADCELLSMAEYNNEFKLNHDKIRHYFRSKGT